MASIIYVKYFRSFKDTHREATQSKISQIYSKNVNNKDFKVYVLTVFFKDTNDFERRLSFFGILPPKLNVEKIIQMEQN